MATINSKGQFSGAAGPVYFRIVNGRGVVQSMPKKHKKAAVIMANASVFGQASRLSRNIRQLLYPVLQDKNDTAMYRRFVAVVHAVMKSVTGVTAGENAFFNGNLSLPDGFEFNINSPFPEYGSIEPTLQYQDNVLIIAFPAFPNTAIKAPTQASGTSFTINVTAFEGEATVASLAEQFVLDLPNNKQQTEAITFTTATIPAGHVAMVTMALFFYKENPLSGRVVLNNRDLHPCRILKVLRN